MSCTTIKVTVIGSPSGVLAIMDAANQAVKDAESAREESFYREMRQRQVLMLLRQVPTTQRLLLLMPLNQL